MRTVIILGVIITLVAIIVAVILVAHLRSRAARALRDKTFREAILKQEAIRDRALLIDKNHPDSYIANREIIRLKARYGAGEKDVV